MKLKCLSALVKTGIPLAATRSSSLCFVQKQSASVHHDGIITGKVFHFLHLDALHADMAAIIIQCDVCCLCGQGIDDEDAGRCPPIIVGCKANDDHGDYAAKDYSCSFLVHSKLTFCSG